MGDLPISPDQTAKALKILRSGRVDQTTLKITQTGELRISIERGGAVDGFQRMSYEIAPSGQTTKIVQTAFDDTNTLLRQRPDQAKNNLYDVKKWTK